MLYRVFFLEGTEIHRNWLNVSKGGVGRSYWNAVPKDGEMETVNNSEIFVKLMQSGVTFHFA